MKQPQTERLTKDQFYPQADHMSAWDIIMMTSTVKTTKQFYSYDLGQLIGELGGSWGLFLGASLITMLELVEKLVKRVVQAAQSKWRSV